MLTTDELIEFLRIDDGTDEQTLAILLDSGIDVVAHETGLDLRDDDFEWPVSLKHAVAVFVSAHFDQRTGGTDAAMVTVRRLCLPHRVGRL